MYLSMLDTKKKHLFLDLELYMAKIDGDFSIHEKEIIDAHCLEMRIDNNGYVPEIPLDNVITELKNTLTIQEKHIVFLELVATILADNVYHENEEALIEKLETVFEISDNEKETAFSIMSDMKKAYERCAAFIK